MVTQIPGEQAPGTEMALYASEQFLADMRAANLSKLFLNQPNAEELARMARAGHEIADLGGIALFGVNEDLSRSTELATEGDAATPSTALAGQPTIFKFRNGLEVAEGPLATFSERHKKLGTRIFSLVVPPDEAAIATAYYRAAVMIPGSPEEDRWMKKAGNVAGGIISVASVILPFGPIVRVAGLGLGAGLSKAGKRIGQWRQGQDLKSVTSKPPVEIRP